MEFWTKPYQQVEYEKLNKRVNIPTTLNYKSRIEY